MAKTTLEYLTSREIILSLIYLKQGKRDFYVEDLKKGLDTVSAESTRLKISWNSIMNTLFFYHPYLCGELDLPGYRLNKEGQKIVQKEFAAYSPELQNRLKKLAEKVWQ